MEIVKKCFVIGLLTLLCSNFATGQKTESFVDGPYVFIKKDSLVYKWIRNKEVITKEFKTEGISEMSLPDSLPFPNDHSFLFDKKRKQEYHFTEVDRFVAISDVHGQYETMIKLLEANKVINESGEWVYGNGHLVLVGDIFDRGNKVNEICWFLYNLEKKAEAKGGKLHVLLGNHEAMIFGADLRYVHKNYRYSMALLKKPYNELYDNNTIIGRWLRTKPIAISINDIAFVHAGISEEVVELNFSFKRINKLFRDKIFDQKKPSIEVSPSLFLLDEGDGPLWYRGYFMDPDFTEENAQRILDKLGYKHIVVGHTSMKNIKSYFNNKIICVDSSIKEGNKGEVLIYEKGQFSRGMLDGSRKEMLE